MRAQANEESQPWRDTISEKKDAPLMNFGGLTDGARSGGAVPYGKAAMSTGDMSPPSHLLSQRPFISSGLSLGLQSNPVGGSDGDSGKRNREEENDSRSGSENLEGISGDDVDQENPRKKTKRYHRHTPQQIQELEALFKECPHPDEKQRLELSKRLCLETRQVKFWFQNRRTQMKTQIERHENSILRQENDKLRAENMAIREAMRSPVCTSCGSPAMLGEVSIEEQHLRIENARLKEELDRVCSLAGKFLGKSVASLTGPISPTFGFTGLTTVAPTVAALQDHFLPSVNEERSLLLELALAAMEELVAMAQVEEPLWLSSSDGSGVDVLDMEQYHRSFRRVAGLSPVGYVAEATRKTAVVIINSLPLVETLMDSTRWVDMFPCIVAKALTSEVISSGVGGTRDGALQLMQAELQVLSPLVGVREVSFLRFCKQHAEGIWAVVDVSVDSARNGFSSQGCRRMPSGCVVQDMSNGCAKVTWVEHVEYDEGQVHHLYRPLFRSGRAFGAGRWLATLQRQCECLAVLMSSSITPLDENEAITPGGKRSMLKLAQRMTRAFCGGVCASSSGSGGEWSRLESDSIGKDVRVMTRKSVSEPGEPSGVVLSAATSVWMPMPASRLFHFLREAAFRSKWDILSNGGPMYEMARIAKGQDADNAVSLLRASAVSSNLSNQTSMLILQETCADATGSMVVYAPVDVPAMHLVMNGGDSAYVALLPSGFAILPDGAAGRTGGGSLLTVGFQILVNGQPTAKLTVESVETVNGLISCTLQKIKTALHCDD